MSEQLEKTQSAKFRREVCRILRMHREKIPRNQRHRLKVSRPLQISYARPDKPHQAPPETYPHQIPVQSLTFSGMKDLCAPRSGFFVWFFNASANVVGRPRTCRTGSEHLSPFDIEVLSQLPPELRLKIWDYAMSEPRSIQLQIYRHYPASGGWLM